MSVCWRRGNGLLDGLTFFHKASVKSQRLFVYVASLSVFPRALFFKMYFMATHNIYVALLRDRRIITEYRISNYELEFISERINTKSMLKSRLNLLVYLSRTSLHMDADGERFCSYGTIYDN